MRKFKSPQASRAQGANNFNQRDCTTPETECEYFGHYEYIDSMQCFDCLKSSSCTLRRAGNLLLEKEQRRKTRARSISGLVRLGYPINQVEAYIDQRDCHYE